MSTILWMLFVIAAVIAAAAGVTYYVLERIRELALRNGQRCNFPQWNFTDIGKPIAEGYHWEKLALAASLWDINPIEEVPSHQIEAHWKDGEHILFSRSGPLGFVFTLPAFLMYDELQIREAMWKEMLSRFIERSTAAEIEGVTPHNGLPDEIKAKFTWNDSKAQGGKGEAHYVFLLKERAKSAFGVSPTPTFISSPKTYRLELDSAQSDQESAAGYGYYGMLEKLKGLVTQQHGIVIR